MKNLTTLLLVLATTPVTSSDLTIDVTPRSENAFELKITSPRMMGEEEAQQTILAAAWKICGGRQPRLGKYNFSGSERLRRESESPGTDEGQESFVFVQEVSCGEEPETKPEPSRALSQEERVFVEGTVAALTNAYLVGQTTGDYLKSYDMLSEFIKSSASYGDWKKQREEFMDVAGPLQETEVWRITIYIDPSGAPEPGIYVAADYEMSFEKVPHKCGYLVWLEQEDRTFRITREETGYLDLATVSRLDESEVAGVKARIGCRVP